MLEYRCDERLKTKTEGITLLLEEWLGSDTRFRGDLEYLKTKTRLKDETVHYESIMSGSFLLWIDKTRGKDRTYIWVSVWWKTSIKFIICYVYVGFICLLLIDKSRVKDKTYYESMNRELNKRLIFNSRCDARLKAKTEGCTRLTYTMWCEEP